MLEMELERLAEMVSERCFGKYRGTVASNEDDENRGRLLVRVPSVLGQTEVWALPCFPVANPDGSGFYAVPDQDASVWVEFEGGNISYPVWTGCFWPKDKVSSQDGVPAVKFWKTKNFSIRIDDDGGEMVIEKADGGKVTITATEVAVEANTVKQTAGGQTTALSQSSFDVNNGALTVV